MPASFSDYKTALSDLSLRKRLVLVHASPAVNADELLYSLLKTTGGFFTPSFTPKSLLPLDFPPVHTDADAQRLASPFAMSTPADEAFGKFPELIRKHANGKRSTHPVLSFAGIGADDDRLLTIVTGEALQRLLEGFDPCVDYLVAADEIAAVGADLQDQ